MPGTIARLADRLANLPNVAAVTLQNDPPEDEQWILGVYHRGSLNPEHLLSFEGTSPSPDNRGPIPDAGTTLAYEGLTVEVRFRDLDAVQHWAQEAEHGRFEVDAAPGHLAGRPTYSMAAEVALDRVLAGSLEGITTYPDHLATAGASHWRRHASASLDHAEARAVDGDVAGVLGHLARASIEAAHARLCEARTWTRNEKEILERAELTHLNQVLTALNADPVTLMQRVMQARALLLD